MAQQIKSFFGYSTTHSSVASGADDTQSINIEADSAFALQKLAYFADIAAAVQTDSSRVIPLATVQIRDTGSGRDLFDNAIPIPSVFGTGKIPFILPEPRIFKPNATLQVIVSNFSASTTYNIRLALLGVKIFG